jgi:hypothetical protein
MFTIIASVTAAVLKSLTIWLSKKKVYKKYHIFPVHLTGIKNIKHLLIFWGTHIFRYFCLNNFCQKFVKINFTKIYFHFEEIFQTRQNNKYLSHHQHQHHQHHHHHLNYYWLSKAFCDWREIFDQLNKKSSLGCFMVERWVYFLRFSFKACFSITSRIARSIKSASSS